MRRRILSALGTLAALVGLGLFVASPAFASGGIGNEWNDYTSSNHFLNAWSEGPYVNVYTSDALNDDFQLSSISGNTVMVFSPNDGSLYDGACISDYNNNSGSARAGLVACGSGGIPWGAIFSTVTCNDNGSPGYAFYDDHWKGWLGPAGNSNGSAFYLNQATASCFAQLDPY